MLGMPSPNNPRIAIIPNMKVTTLRSAGELPFAPYPELSAALGGNAGNTAFVDGLLGCLKNASLSSWHGNVDAIRKRADVIMVSCANQLGDHAHLEGWNSKLRELDMPTILVGIGVQAPKRGHPITLRPSTREMLDFVVEKAEGKPAILVRGSYTRSVLAAHGYPSIVIGCPSLFLSPYREIGASISQAIIDGGLGERAAVAAGNPYDPGFYNYELPLIDLVSSHDGAYIVQHPAEMIGLARRDAATLPDAFFQTLAPRFWPNLDRDAVLRWARRHAHVFADSQEWMTFLRRYDYCIGARYHGVALAVQAGLPGLILTIDSRTEELADTTGLPFIPFSDFAGQNLKTMVRDAWGKEQGTHFDRRRRKLAARFADILAEYGIGVGPKLELLSGKR